MTGFPSTMMDSLPKSALHAKAFSFEEVIMVERPLNLLLVFLSVRKNAYTYLFFQVPFVSKRHKRTKRIKSQFP